MSRPGFLRFIPLWPFVIGGLLFVAWHQRLEIAAWVLSRVTSVGNLEDLEITPAHFDTERLVLERLAFTMKAGSSSYRIVGDDLELSLAPVSGLLPEPRALKVTSLRMDTLSSGDAETTPLTVRGLRQGLLDALALGADLPGPPLSRIDVERLRVDTLSSLGLTGEPSLALDLVDRQIDAELSLDDTRVIAAVSPGIITLTVRDRVDAVPPPLTLRLERRGEDPGVSGQVDLDALAQRAAENGIEHADGLGLPAGAIDLDAALALKGGAVLLDLDLSGALLSSRGMRTEDWHLVLPVTLAPDLPLMELASERIRLEDGVRLEAGLLHAGELEIGRLLTTPRGEMDPATGALVFTADSMLSAGRVAGNTFSATDLTLAPALDHASDTVTVRAGSSVRLGSLQLTNGWAVNDLAMEATSDALIRLPPEGPALDTSAWLVDITADDGEGSRFHLDGEISVSRAAPAAGDITLSITRPEMELGGEPLPLDLDLLDARLSWLGEQLSFSGEALLAAEPVSLRFEGEHDLGSGSGAAIWRSGEVVDLATARRLVLRLAPGTLADLGVESGGVAVNGEASWNDDGATLDASLDVQDAVGLFDDIRFEGLALSGQWQLLPTLATPSPARLKIATLEYGVALRDIAVSLVPEFNANTFASLRVLWFQGGLFDGRISGGPFSLDLDAPDTSFDMVVQDLDIARVVEAQNVEGLSADGRISGRLPVEITAAGIRIDNGRLRSVGGGNISYLVSDEQAAALANPLTDVVIQALRDFRYDLLTTTVRYDPDGTLDLALHIEGRSPSLDTDRPVHLNINSEQNVLSLLRSLDYSDGLSESLDREIQEHYDRADEAGAQ